MGAPTANNVANNVIAFPGNPDPADLIADYGDPGFPFWPVIVAILLAAQIALTAQQALGGEAAEAVRTPRGGGRIVRVVRGGRSAREGRTAFAAPAPLRAKGA